MEFKEGTSVYSSDEKNAGNIHQVVIDPETKEVTHIIILRGPLFKDDKVIPVENVVSASQESVVLNCKLEEIKAMSPLDIKKYTPLDEASGGAQSYSPTMGGLYSNPGPQPYVVTETTRTIPEELVVLKEGARVISSDEEHVGNIERVYTDPDSGKVSRFIVSQGLLLKTKKAVPIQMVDKIEDDEVYLSVGAQQLAELPEEES